MTYVITFTSSVFDTSAETPNPINPIAGESVLKWLCEQLASNGYDITTPEPEDWGWYIYVKDKEVSYLVGASSDVDQPIPREWTIQIHKQRSLTDKLMGRNKLASEDPLSACIEKIIRERVGVKDVRVNKSA